MIKTLVKATVLRHKSSRKLKVKKMMLELILPSHTLPPHQNSSITVEYSGESFTAETLEGTLKQESPKARRQRKNKDTRGVWSLGILYNKNINHSPTSSWININPHTKGLLTSELYSHNVFQQNIQEKVQFEGPEQWELRSYMTQMLELSDKDFKTTIINTLRDLMEKVDHMQTKWVMSAVRWKL